MSDIINGVKNVIMEDRFHVFDSAGNPVNNLLDGVFTKTLINPSGLEVSGAIPVTVTFLSNGEYKVLWVNNASGRWSASVYHPTYRKTGWHSIYEIYDSAFSIHTAVDVAVAVWDRFISSLTTAGSIGKYIIDYLNATITSRAPVNEYDTILSSIQDDTTEILGLNYKNAVLSDQEYEVYEGQNLLTYAKLTSGSNIYEITATYTLGQQTSYQMVKL